MMLNELDLIKNDNKHCHKFNNKGVEFRFCMNDFPDLVQEMDKEYKNKNLNKVLPPNIKHKNYKVSLFIFKLYHVLPDNDVDRLEINVT